MSLKVNNLRRKDSNFKRPEHLPRRNKAITKDVVKQNHQRARTACRLVGMFIQKTNNLNSEIIKICGTKNKEEQVYQTTNKSEIVNKIITDSNFYQLIYTYVSESDKIYSDTNNVDIIQHSNKKLSHALSQFLTHNPSFVLLSQGERMMILKSVADSFKLKSQFMNHPNHQVVNLIEKLNTNKMSDKEIRTYSNSY